MQSTLTINTALWGIFAKDAFARWELVENDPYYLEVSRNIHLNPVKADMVERPNQYRWSNYASYVQDDVDNTLVDTGKILGYFMRYQKFVE